MAWKLCLRLICSSPGTYSATSLPSMLLQPELALYQAIIAKLTRTHIFLRQLLKAPSRISNISSGSAMDMGRTDNMQVRLLRTNCPRWSRSTFRYSSKALILIS